MTVDPLTVLREALKHRQRGTGSTRNTKPALAALAAVEQLVGALRELESWQPQMPRGMSLLHPQHVEAIHKARAALARFEGDSQQGTAA